jgi:hypothetical protein
MFSPILLDYYIYAFGINSVNERIHKQALRTKAAYNNVLHIQHGTIKQFVYGVQYPEKNAMMSGIFEGSNRFS